MKHVILLLAIWLQALPGAKAMFYDPADRGSLPPLPSGSRLRPIDGGDTFLHCGIHYWFETAAGTPLTERMASGTAGQLTLHIRSNTAGGFLTVWDVTGEGRELTPIDPNYSRTGRWSGQRMTDVVYVVPDRFEFTRESPRRIVIVWARSQTEVADSAAYARQRLVDMPASMPIVRESDESTPGEIGTYVMNRGNAGVATEIVLRAR